MTISRKACVALLAAIAAVAACTGPDEVGQTGGNGAGIWPRGDTPPEPAEPDEAALRGVPGTLYFQPQDAPKTGDIMVRSINSDAQHRLITHVPGQVTILVFSGMFMNADKAALRHVRDLLTEFKPNIYGLRAIGIIEKTKFQDRAVDFHRDQKLGYDMHYDDKKCTALRAMARRVRADGRRFPAIFIIDRKGRIRFYRPGFAYYTVVMGASREKMTNREKPSDAVVVESVRSDETIRSYLKRILEEGI